MDRYKETFETWDKLATLYQDKFMDLDLYNVTYDFLCDSLHEKNSAILELGCGPGNISRYLLSKRPDLKIFATDISPNMIKLASINNPSARFEVMDCRQIDQINSKFDAVICGFCVPYISLSECEKLISDTNHLLKKNGLLYISYVEGYPENSGFLKGSTGDRTYFYFHRTDTLKTILSSHKFEIIRMFNLEYLRSQTEREIHTVLITMKA